MVCRIERKMWITTRMSQTLPLPTPMQVLGRPADPAPYAILQHGSVQPLRY